MQRRHYFKQREEEKSIALERVKILFKLAGQEFNIPRLRGKRGKRKPKQKT